jgi:hypothetical protein
MSPEIGPAEREGRPAVPAAPSPARSPLPAAGAARARGPARPLDAQERA